jgi:hypothetical protein
MKYEEIYTRSIEPKHLGSTAMKLNGIVNRRFCRKMKMDIHLVQRWRIEHFYLARSIFKMDMAIKPPLFMIPSNANYKKNTPIWSKTK